MAADQAKPTQAVDTTVDPKEPFEVLWPKYLARVVESVRDAEQHLTVPAGAISSIPSDPDFIATVKTYAVIEPILNDLIVAAYPPRPLLGFLGSSNEDYRTFVTSLNIGGRNGKLELAVSFQ